MPRPRMSSRSRAPAVKLAELSLAAPQVIAHRLARMAMAGPVLSDRDRREFVGMVTEKQLAFSQAWVAMFTEGARLQQQLLSAALMGATPAALGRKSRAGISRVASKGLSPVHSKAVSNAKRLGKTKPR